MKAASPPDGSSSTARSGRILIVDDEPLVRESIRRLLVDAGYDVDLAQDGAAGLACLAHSIPDAVLVDLMMPSMNGREFLRNVQRDPGLAGLPVILMTGITGLSVPAEVLGAVEVIEKPFDSEELLNKLALAVYRARQTRSGGQPEQPIPEVLLRSEPHTRPATAPIIVDGEACEAGERGVVMVVLRNRSTVTRLDALLSARGYTVVSLTRITSQLPRMARALRPRALLVDVIDATEQSILEQVRADVSGPLAPVIFVANTNAGVTELIDADLLQFVDSL